MWIFRPAAKEVEFYENVEDLLSREALSFLGGLGELKKDFRVLRAEPGDPARLQLKPRAKDSVLKQLDLAVDPKSFTVVGATLYPVGGNVSTYRFANLQLNPKLAPDAFAFQAPRGTREIRP